MTILLMTALSAFGCSGEDWTPPPGVEMGNAEGWTADGRWFAFSVTHFDEAGEYRRGGGVVDTRTDGISIFEAEEYEAWKTEHPVTKGSTDASCGAGEVIIVREDLSGTRQAMPNGYNSTPRWNSASVKAWGQEWVVHESRSYVPSHMWSPTCDYVAWTRPSTRLDTDGDGVLPFNGIGALTVRPAGPVVHIVVHKNAQDTTEPLVKHLSEEGWAPHIGPAARKDRDKTVVYATDEAMELAQTMAKSLPGGATTELMTWPSPGDIIVAAGRSVTR